MIKKLLYAIGIFFGFIIFLGLILPDPPEENITEENPQISKEVSTTTSTASTTPVIVEDVSPQLDNNTFQESNSPQANFYTVTRVVDGDTINIDINGTTETIRLIGVNTPETVDPRKSVECFGREASNKAKELLSDRKVRIGKDSTQGERDKYGRLLAYVYRDDGLFINKRLIEEGYAYEYTYNIPYKYQAEFKQAQKNAEAEHKGLWAPGACDAPQPISTTPSPAEQPMGHAFYLSTHHTARFYYCDTDEAWKSLSPKYLKSYSSEQELLKNHPDRTLHELCK